MGTTELKQCSLCGGKGEILIRAKRQMGYTLGFDENPEVLEEHWEDCPICQSPAKKGGV